MKHRKNRSSKPNSKLKQAAGYQTTPLDKIDEQSRDFSEPIRFFPIAEDDAAAIMIGNMTDTTSCSSAIGDDDDSVDCFSIFTDTGSSSNGSSAFSNYSRRSRKIVISTRGMVSNILGKDYVPSSKGIGVQKRNGPADVEKAWEGMPDLVDISECTQHHNLNTTTEDVMTIYEECARLTGRPSYFVASSDNDIQGNMSFMGCDDRSYLDVLASPVTSSEQTQTHDVLEAVDVKGKSPLHELDDWVKVVKKAKSNWLKVDYRSEDIAKKQHNPADEYKNFRCNANQHWENMRSFDEKSAIAIASGEFGNAEKLSNQARMWREMGEQADEKASEEIFNSRNKKYIVNLMTIDLHGQHEKEGIEISKHYLAFGVYGRSLRQLQIITGYGSHGTGPSVLKQAVIDLLQKENIKWKEENRGTLLITFDGQKRELGFLKW